MANERDDKSEQRAFEDLLDDLEDVAERIKVDGPTDDLAQERFDIRRQIHAARLATSSTPRVSGAICVKCITPEHCIERKTCAFGREQTIPYPATVTPSATKAVELEEGFRYWTHEGYVCRFNEATEQTELLGPGGWSPAL